MGEFSFGACNESNVLLGIFKRYGNRARHCPQRVFDGKICRNREDLVFCKLHAM